MINPWARVGEGAEDTPLSKTERTESVNQGSKMEKLL